MATIKVSANAATALPLTFLLWAAQSLSQLHNRLVLHQPVPACVIAAIVALQDDSVRHCCILTQRSGFVVGVEACRTPIITHLTLQIVRRKGMETVGSPWKHKYSFHFSCYWKQDTTLSKERGLFQLLLLRPSTRLTHLPRLPASGGISLTLWWPLSCLDLKSALHVVWRENCGCETLLSLYDILASTSWGDFHLCLLKGSNDTNLELSH